MSGSNEEENAQEPRTVFAPLNPTVAPTGGAQIVDALQTPQEIAPRQADGRIQIGDILNHIFEVRRFIARGGMGEVYEGVNINTDERVAIKVMLPALAADPNVQAMFRKEARTLTRLSHPALVQYRVLAQEPHLGVFYIVTDYIDGKNLSDVLGSVPHDAASLLALMRRLADGLRVAHELGAVHRDISPDNVLLEDGLLERSRIIDFGIAKDLDPAKGTIVGDGFAGKLNYVAPEQLGDFDREMGPWTDVYSLALVILAVAGGSDVAMGATLVDAVDKRRAGVDISAAPENIQPILAAMLRPNPQDRMRSMRDVISAIDDPLMLSAVAIASPLTMAADPGSFQVPVSALFRANFERLPGRKVWIGAVTAISLVTLIGFGIHSFRSERAAPLAPQTPSAQSLDQSARAAIIAALPTVGCSWLDLQSLKTENGTVSVRFAGVAGSTATAQAAISSAIIAKGVKLGSIDFEDVAPIRTSACAVLDAYHAIKSAQTGNLLTDQAKYEMSRFDSGHFSGQTGAVPQIHISPNLLNTDVALVGIESNGSMSVLLPSAAALKSAVSTDPQTGSINADGSITLKGFITTTGWSGILAISGRGPFDSTIVAPPANETGTEWQSQLKQAAMAHGWKADMVWFKIVDELPNTAVTTSPVAPPSIPTGTVPPKF